MNDFSTVILVLLYLGLVLFLSLSSFLSLLVVNFCKSFFFFAFYCRLSGYIDCLSLYPFLIMAEAKGHKDRLWDRYHESAFDAKTLVWDSCY